LLTAWTADALDQRDERMIPMRICRGIGMTTPTNPNTSFEEWAKDWSLCDRGDYGDFKKASRVILGDAKDVPIRIAVEETA
jgi:hypothetical protein